MSSNTTNNAVMMTNGSDTIPGTGWTYAAAIDAASEHRRESRLFGSRTDQILARHGEASHTKRGKRSVRQDRAEIRGTGWSWADAVDAAEEHAREVRAYPDPTERALSRFPEFEDGIVFIGR